MVDGQHRIEAGFLRQPRQPRSRGEIGKGVVAEVQSEGTEKSGGGKQRIRTKTDTGR